MCIVWRAGASMFRMYDAYVRHVITLRIDTCTDTVRILTHTVFCVRQYRWRLIRGIRRFGLRCALTRAPARATVRVTSPPVIYKQAQTYDALRSTVFEIDICLAGWRQSVGDGIVCTRDARCNVAQLKLSSINRQTHSHRRI